MLPTAYAAGSIFCFVSGLLCLVTGCILLLFSDRKYNLLLGLSYLALCYGLLIASLVSSWLLLLIPHVYRTGNIFLLLYMPLSYLYVRSSITRKPLTSWQLVHLLPVLLYIFDFLPFFLLSGEHKAAVIREDLADVNQLLGFRQGWLMPDNFYFTFRLVQMTLYWILQVRLLASRKTRIRMDNRWLRWQYFYNAFQLFIFLPTLVVILSGGRFHIPVAVLFPASASLLSAITLMLFPHVLYNLKHPHKLQQCVKVKPGGDDDFLQGLRQHIENFMQEKKPFLDPDYTIGQMAVAMGLPSHKLSGHLYEITRMHFSDYINQWRIRYCLEQISAKKIVHLNLNGVASTCGFNNRNTFASAFKKVTGKSPSRYLHAKA